LFALLHPEQEIRHEKLPARGVIGISRAIANPSHERDLLKLIRNPGYQAKPDFPFTFRQFDHYEQRVVISKEFAVSNGQICNRVVRTHP
jgi:hypothetical protein